MRKLTISFAAVALGLGLVNCGGKAADTGSSLPAGSLAQNPDPNIDTYFVVETNSGGDESAMHVLRTLWGRLVDVYAQGDATPRLKDFLIGDDIVTDGFDFELVRNPVTSKDELTVLHAWGTPEFKTAFSRLEAGLQPFLIKGLDPTTLPPFTAVPRNAAVAVVFSDLLNDGGDPTDAAYPSTVTPANVRLRVGYPPSSHFEARVFPDPNHGDLQGGQFHSTRVILDMTVSQFETGVGGLTPNGVGLPEAVNTAQPNVAIRLPTHISVPAQQFSVLTNLGGHPVSFTGNGATDPTASTLDVVRAFRSGGRTSVTGDLFNGFLRDDAKPTVVGSQTVQLTGVGALGGPLFLVSYQFAVPACAIQPRKGTLLDLGAVVCQATQDGFAPIAGLVSNLPIKVIQGNPALLPTLINGLGDLRSAWDVALGAPPECFVKLSPGPGTPPFAVVSNLSTIELNFSEPIDPESVRGFDTFALNYSPPPTNPLRRKVAGLISPSLDLTTYTLSPVSPLKHVAAAADVYTLTLTSGPTGITDLAGNPLASPLATAGGNPPRFTLDPSQAAVDSGSLGLTFNATDEDGNSAPEIRGELVYDLARGRIGPRSVSRFSGIVDGSNSIINILLTGGGGPFSLVPPLTRFGARVQTVWRYHDMGFTLMDSVAPNPQRFSDAAFDLDVEGLSWTPATGQALLDNYPRFQMALAHSKFLPDESNTPFIDSGLTETFADNVLDPVNDPLTVVHPAGSGYVIQPLDAFTTNSGTRMTPWPLNRDVPLSNFAYYTWRDTTKTAVGGVNSAGADYALIGPLGINDPNFLVAYGAGSVPTIGLPLLMEFRTYPSTLSGVFNPLAGVLALPGTPTQFETKPFFTSYSAGGVTSGGVINNLEPDAAATATGTTPPGGPNNLPLNQFIYFGQADFVTRVNRVHTVWLDCGSLNATFAGPLPEPSTSAVGTQVTIAFRGATGLTNPTPAGDANNYDPYGNPAPGVNFLPTFVNGDASWKSDISGVNGAQFVQVRITMISNAESGATPVLSSLGFGFSH